jgi:uncharacterized protein YwgA
MNSKLLPLGLLAAAEDETIEGITRFQKLVFLAQREELNEQPYEFEAEKYGPFSQRLYDDLDRLVEEGFVDRSREQTQLRNTKQVYELTDKGRHAVVHAPVEQRPNTTGTALREFDRVYNQMNLWSLLEYVYDEYPKMAKNSVLDL